VRIEILLALTAQTAMFCDMMLFSKATYTRLQSIIFQKRAICTYIKSSISLFLCWLVI